MIKFFRQIRYNLMETGKTSKYFKYAIGEIVLVVIGILIALSINNWNEDRKQLKKEIALLKELRKEIIRDTIEIDFYKSIIKISEHSIKQINIAFETNNFTDSINNYFGGALFKSNWQGSTATYQTLKSEGLSIISNDTVRKKIIRLYEETQPFIKNSEKNLFMDDAHFKNYCTALFDNISFAADISDNGFNPSTIQPHDLNALKEDKLYKTLINTRLSEIEFMDLFVLGIAKKEYIALLKSIDAELNHLEQ